MLRASLALAAYPCAAATAFGCGPRVESANADVFDDVSSKSKSSDEANAMKIHYLEIVTPEVEAVCAAYSQVHGVKFDEADPHLGGARTAKLAHGGLVGVRGPLRDTETPVVRPFLQVENLEAALAAAEKAGAKIALPPMKIKGHGTCGIFIQGGIECGLWQV